MLENITTPYWKTKQYKKEKQKEWRDKNPEKSLKLVMTAYDKRRSTKEGWLGQVLSTAKARAARKGLTSDISASEIEMPTHCPILGMEIHYGAAKKNAWESASLDRIDNSKGYVRGNVRVISRKANTLRNNCTDPKIFEALAADARRLLGE